MTDLLMAAGWATLATVLAIAFIWGMAWVMIGIGHFIDFLVNHKHGGKVGFGLLVALLWLGMFGSACLVIAYPS